MRRLVIAALSTLILLCIPLSPPQGRGLHSIRWTPFTINLLRAGSPDATSLRPGAPPVQSPASTRGAALSAQESISLEPSKTIERELSGGQSHFYKIAMTSGQYLRITVSQQGIDALVALFTPDGNKVGEVDSDQATVGSEMMSAVAEAAGAYKIEVRSTEKTAKTGRYEIKVEELREATAEDNYRVVAESVFRDARRLQNGTLEARRKSIEKYHEALELFRQAGDRDDEATTLNNIGRVYQSLGEMKKAIEKYDEALPIRRSIGDRNGEAVTLNNIGSVYQSAGEMQKALEKYNEALPIFQAIGSRDGEVVILNNIGSLYLSLGETQKALEKHSEALLIRRAIGDRNGEAVTLNNIGSVYQSAGEMQKALEKHNEALQLRRAIGDKRGEAVTLHNIGRVYNSLGDGQKALEKFNEALRIRRAVSDRSGEAHTLHNIGQAYVSLGDMQKALENYREALRIRQEIGERDGEASSLLGIARVEQARGNTPQARQAIEQAVGIIESLRAGLHVQDLRTSYFASRREYYESYIDILMKMHRKNPSAGADATAFAVSERARARFLLELLTESRADIRQGVDGSLLERERSLQQLLNAKAAAQFALLNRKHTPEQAEAAAKEIASIIAEYEGLEAQIRASSPKYAALTQSQPLSLSEIQQQALDPETLLLEYSLGEDASYLFAVSHTSITSHQLPKRAEIEAVARSVYELLTAPQPGPGEAEAKRQSRIEEARANYWPQAATLSRMLLGPVSSQLGKKRLVIVADGALQYIPFAALPAPSPGNDEGQDSGAEPQPLIVEHEIVSLPSASTLSTLRRETAGRKPAEKSLAVLADPVFMDDDTRVRRNVSKAPAKEKTRPADSDEIDIASRQMARSG